MPPRFSEHLAAISTARIPDPGARAPPRAKHTTTPVAIMRLPQSVTHPSARAAHQPRATESAPRRGAATVAAPPPKGPTAGGDVILRPGAGGVVTAQKVEVDIGAHRVGDALARHNAAVGGRWPAPRPPSMFPFLDGLKAQAAADLVRVAVINRAEHAVPVFCHIDSLRSALAGHGTNVAKSREWTGEGEWERRAGGVGCRGCSSPRRLCTGRLRGVRWRRTLALCGGRGRNRSGRLRLTMNVVRGGLLVLLASSTMARVARTTHLRTVPARGREEGRAKSVTNLEVVTVQVCARSRHTGERGYGRRGTRQGAKSDRDGRLIPWSFWNQTMRNFPLP